MNVRYRWGAAGVVLGAMAMVAIPSFGGSTPSPRTAAAPASAARTITVTGLATVKSQPDLAVVSLGVQVQAGSASDAMRINAQRMSKVVNSLLAAGVARSDLATTSVDLYGNTEPNGNKIISYTASNQIDVTVRHLDKVGAVIDRAVGAGANLTGGITFKVSDQNSGVPEALAQAEQVARTKAGALATAGGAHLGVVMSIREESASSGPPIYQKAAFDAAAPTPVLPPTLESQVVVTVVWAIS